MIVAAGYPRSVPIEYSSGAPQDPIEQTVAGDESKLNYVSAGHYTYIWKTDPSWAGQSRQLQIKLNDGQLQTANFRFR